MFIVRGSDQPASWPRGNSWAESFRLWDLFPSEDFVVADGRVRTSSLAEYAIPTSLDIPDEFSGESIETPYPRFAMAPRKWLVLLKRYSAPRC